MRKYRRRHGDVTYLSAIYNQIDNVEIDSYDEFELSEESDRWNEDDDRTMWNSDENDEEEEDSESEWENKTEWIENPWRVPVIKDTELMGGSPISPFGYGGINYAGMSMPSDNNGEIDSFSQEAIAQLIVELEKHGMDRLVMFAGYGGENDERIEIGGY